MTIHDATLATLVSVTATDPVASESASIPERSAAHRRQRVGIDGDLQRRRHRHQRRRLHRDQRDDRDRRGPVVCGPHDRAPSPTRWWKAPSRHRHGDRCRGMTSALCGSGDGHDRDQTDPCSVRRRGDLIQRRHSLRRDWRGARDGRGRSRPVQAIASPHHRQITDHNDFRPWIRLIAPNGATLGDTAGVAAAAINGAVAPVTGTYQSSGRQLRQPAGRHRHLPPDDDAPGTDPRSR